MKRILSALLALCVLFLSVPQLRASALASVFEHSDSYRASEYYTALISVELTGDLRRDIASVALSQVGYHEGKSAADLGGASSGKNNFTEYGRNFGLEGDSWCSVFVWWCARQAGINESIIYKTEWAKASLQPFESLPLSQCGNIRVGDIAFIDMSYGDGIEDHSGIIVGVSDDTIITVEGNTSNGVRKQTYSRKTGLREDGNGKLLYVGSPHYSGTNSSEGSYETVFVRSFGASVYSSIGGAKLGTLDDGKYMLLASDPSGQWLQIVAPNGIDSQFISSSANASFSTENLPPITGFDAWTGFEPSTTVTSSDIIAPVQTDPSVTTTTTTTTTSTTASTTVPTEPTVPVQVESAPDDNGYTSSFGTEWIQYAAYALLGVLAIAFIVILASLMGRRDDTGHNDRGYM